MISMYKNGEYMSGSQGVVLLLMTILILSSLLISISYNNEIRTYDNIQCSTTVIECPCPLSEPSEDIVTESPCPSANRGNGEKYTLTDYGFTPLKGDNSTVYNFTVTYTHEDGQGPEDHRIIIDAIFYDMEFVSGDPFSGSIYEYHTALSMGSHNYWFFFNNTYFPEDDVFPGPVVNSPPRLFWTLEEHYENNGVFPITGISTDDFVFRLMYTDDDNDHPGDLPNFIHLVLDNTHYAMETVDENFQDGSIFSYNLTGLFPGEHEYYFECFDGSYNVRFPGTVRLSLPVINTRPELIVPRLPSTGGNERAGQVYPLIANSTDEFTFQIIYKDIDGHPPSTNRDSRGVYIDNIFYPMVPQEGVGSYYDESYANGEIFELTMSLPIGDHHSYYFEFIDEQGAINHTPVYDGPDVVVGFPDLRIASYEGEPIINGAPVSPSHDDRYHFTISAEIENPSDFSVTKPFWVSFDVFYADRTTGIFSLVDTLYANVHHLFGNSGETVIVEYEPDFMGNYKVTVTVDCDLEVLEIVDNNDTRTNNVGFGYFSVGPDLVVSNKDIQPSSGYVSRAYFLSAKIYNIGPTTAVFRPDDPLEIFFAIDGRLYFDHIYEPIEPGSFVLATNNSYLSPTVGEFVLTVKVDEKGKIEEVAEFGTYDNNNYGFKMISIIEMAGSSSSPSFSPSPVLLLYGLLLISLLGFAGKRKSD